MRVTNFTSILLHVCMLMCFQQVLTSNYAGITLNSSCQFNVSANGRNREFDLSSLSSQGKWQAQVNSSVYVFVAMCGQFSSDDADKCPDKEAAVCVARQVQDSWEPVVRNAGKSLRVNSSNGHDFSVNIIGGERCKASKNYSTKIFFKCNPVEELVYVSSSDECLLILYWSTSAACISNQEVVDSCTLSLHGGVDHFDIRSLHRPENYLVQTASGRTFELNLCLAGSSGLCVNSSVAVCEITNNSRQIIGVFNKHVLEYSTDTGLQLVYKTEHKAKHPKRTVISLRCNYTAKTGTPVFVGEDDHAFKFEMDTWTSCVQWPVECSTYDKEGSKYDLKGLRRRTGNWEVPSETPDKKYYINVCAAVNLDDSYRMKGVGVAECSAKQCSSLGTLSTGPVKEMQEHLKLHYTGGSACRNGTSRYKTDISFLCARVEKGPQLMSSEDCVHSFLWETPAACPTKYAVGSQCVVKEPSLNTIFRLSSLHNEQHDYAVLWEDGISFSLNMCGPLVEPCAGFKNASVCLKTGSQEIPIGWTSYEPVYTDGRISFELRGAECEPGHPSTVHIIFMCNASYEAAPAIINFLSRDELCNFFFVWHSHETCFPNKQVICKAKDDKGTVYDLTSLSSVSGNYMYIHHDDAGQEFKFTINVCRSVVAGYGSFCGYNSAICVENLSLANSRNSLVSIGEVTGPPAFENGLLTLRYESGSVCHDAGPPEISSSIVFKCDPFAVETNPVLDKIENCHYHFSWRTEVACSQREPRESKQKDIETGNCTTVDPTTKIRFDLSSLKKRSYTFKNMRGTVFKVSVCGDLSPDVCGSDAGACQSDGSEHTLLGRSNSHLMYNSVLYLNYTDGDACRNGTSRRNTWLQFVCGPENSTPGPSFVDELDGCTTVVAWNTELACERKVPCEVIVGDRLVSLAPLIGSGSNYKFASQNYEFYINVCRPTVPVEGLSCVGGSAACVATRRSDGSLTDELSLGVPYMSPLEVNGSIILKYLNGSPCTNSPGINISTSLNFTCDPTADKGNPQLKILTDDCQYQFDWKTSIVCPPQIKKEIKDIKGAVNSNCSFLVEERNANISLLPLTNHADLGAVVKGKKGNIFHVNPCQLKSLCNGMAVCKQDSGHNISYGLTPSVIFNHAKQITILRFTDGSVCSLGKKHSSEIYFECDPDEVIGRPVVQREDNCSVAFFWKTSMVCFDGDTHALQSSGSSSAAVVPAVVGTLLLVAAIAALIYFRKAFNRIRFRSWLNSRFTTERSQGCVQYSKLGTTDEACVILRGPLSGTESASDDDELLGL